MITVSIHELRRQTSALIRLVRQEGQPVQICDQGQVVVMLIPVERAGCDKQEKKAWLEIDQLAAEIGARWPAGVSAAQAVAEGRESGAQ